MPARLRKAHSTSIIDLGGGESTLVDDLLAHEYSYLSVLDVSPAAIDVTKRRLGHAAERIHWIIGDITNAELPPSAYDLWHDRAVFHFLRSVNERAAYVRQVAKEVRPGGHVLMSTFGPENPTKCT